MVIAESPASRFFENGDHGNYGRQLLQVLTECMPRPRSRAVRSSKIAAILVGLHKYRAIRSCWRYVVKRGDQLNSE